jgi:leucyl/phenylalanyl-tRNA--protein transferase
MKEHKIPVPILSNSLLFPPASQATSEGLVAVGGDLGTDRLMLAYKSGIFPWFNDDSLILWWSPDPRMVLFPNRLKISRSMKRLLRKGRFKVTRNRDFTVVISQCARSPRKGQTGTWITEHMIQAYEELHKLGHAVSYEVWEGGRLVGGLYGIDLGYVFCGESMFSLASNASKVAFVHMAREMEEKGYRCIDCQVYSDHLASLGAEEMPREDFLELLKVEDQ